MQYLKAKIEKPLTFISCGHFISDAGWIHNKRIIDSFEIIIGVKGTAYIQQDDTRYEVTTGDILLLSPGHVHEGYLPSIEGSSFYWFHFYIKDQYYFLEQKEALTEISTLQTSPYMNLLNESILIPTFSRHESREKIGILLRQLLHISKSKYYTPFAANYSLTAILIEISQQNIDTAFKAYDADEFNNSKFVVILEWIRVNIQRDISVEELSKKFSFNKDYLSRLFKKHLGVGIIKYINGMKISMAKELLCQSDKDIKEIAFHLGFLDDKYFMKLFKEYEGMTPTEFRNAYYQTHLNSK